MNASCNSSAAEQAYITNLKDNYLPVVKNSLSKTGNTIGKLNIIVGEKPFNLYSRKGKTLLTAAGKSLIFRDSNSILQLACFEKGSGAKKNHGSIGTRKRSSLAELVFF